MYELNSGTKIQDRESIFKYQSRIYNVQNNSDANIRGIKMRQNHKPFQLLNVINGKTSPIGSKGILRHYHYQSDPKLSPGIVAIRIIPFRFHAFKIVLFVYWYSMIKEAVNQPRYG